ncbi:MAG: hypothetical protein Q8M37_11125 [Nevskia sp.]|nr:hypothetical protein [Nevskia sp.]
MIGEPGGTTRGRSFVRLLLITLGAVIRKHTDQRAELRQQLTLGVREQQAWLCRSRIKPWHGVNQATEHRVCSCHRRQADEGTIGVTRCHQAIGQRDRRFGLAGTRYIFEQVELRTFRQRQGFRPVLQRSRSLVAQMREQIRHPLALRYLLRKHAGVGQRPVGLFAGPVPVIVNGCCDVVAIGEISGVGTEPVSQHGQTCEPPARTLCGALKGFEALREQFVDRRLRQQQAPHVIDKLPRAALVFAGEMPVKAAAGCDRRLAVMASNGAQQRRKTMPPHFRRCERLRQHIFDQAFRPQPVSKAVVSRNVNPLRRAAVQTLEQLRFLTLERLGELAKVVEAQQEAEPVNRCGFGQTE